MLCALKMPPTPATSARITAGCSNTRGTSATGSGIEARNSSADSASPASPRSASPHNALRCQAGPTHRSVMPSGSATSSRMKRPIDRWFGSVCRTS